MTHDLEAPITFRRKGKTIFHVLLDVCPFFTWRQTFVRIAVFDRTRGLAAAAEVGGGVACHETICWRDTAGHGAAIEIAEQFASDFGPVERGFRDSRHRCTTERLTPSAVAASRTDRPATSSKRASARS